MACSLLSALVDDVSGAIRRRPDDMYFKYRINDIAGSLFCQFVLLSTYTRGRCDSPVVRISTDFVFDRYLI